VWQSQITQWQNSRPWLSDVSTAAHGAACQ
jgi:hypothetical protein